MATLGGASHPLSTESAVSDSLGQRKTHKTGRAACASKQPTQHSTSKLRLPKAFRAIPHLDPALQARLRSALQRPEIHPETRAKIEAVLNQSKNDET